MQTKKSGGIDRFRLIAAALVVAIHTSPLTILGENADFFLTRILARVAVPFFLMVTGQFVLADILSSDRRLAVRKWLLYLRKICLFYGIAILLYLPIGIYAGHYHDLSPAGMLQMLFFDGTFYHLWYFPACIIGMSLMSLLGCFMNLQGLTVLAGILYFFGLLGDSYFGFIEKVPFLGALYGYIFQISSYTRNGIFFAPLFLVLGAWAGQGILHFHWKVHLCALLLCFTLMTGEGFWLHTLGVQRHDSMYLMLPLTVLVLYQLLLCREVPVSKTARKVSMGVYILHPAVIVAIRLLAKVLGITGILVDNSLVHYFAVLALSLMVAVGIAAGARLLLPSVGRKSGEGQTGCRAWVELNMKALAQNVRFLQSRLPEGCALMPALKANAYGHGVVPIAKALNSLGIRAFCVASAEEGMELRKAGIKGKILILGYTHPTQWCLLRRYRLTQTVVDYEYACKLNEYGKKLSVHIGVDTGMHRIGERVENIERICEIFEMPNLVIEGLFTHLSACDTRTPQDRAFTMQQADAFHELADTLQEMGYSVPKLHIQSSYGVLNYPDLAGDYARVGIALYGLLSTAEDTELWSEELTPVLSLKARVTSLRKLYPGESAGYGADFIAVREMKVAALSIGYADGLPRGLSNGAGNVLIKGKCVPILGRICMDQTIVDVSSLPQVEAGDIAVLIGSSGDLSISASDLAAQTGTITNEILSRLGSRLERTMESI